MAEEKTINERSSILLPVKGFHDAKERLAPLFDPVQRYEIAKSLAEGVIAASQPHFVAVVCDDKEVASWAKALGVIVIWAPNKGLNAAVEHGVVALEQQGFSSITVSHADLPYPQKLTSLINTNGITLIPDRHRDGTNVIKLPSNAGFHFSYGPGSFARHVAEAKRLGLECDVIEHEELSIDIDSPEDMAFVQAQTRPWGPEGPH